MDIFEAFDYNEEEYIELKQPDDIEKIFRKIESEENFILRWENEDGEMQSELIIANHILGKVKNGDLRVFATEEEE